MSGVGGEWVSALSEERARGALVGACGLVGLDWRGETLRRIGTNAVFLLPAEGALARIVEESAGSLPRVERTVAVARWLEVVGFPATRLLPFAQPVHAVGCLVTFWRQVARQERWAGLGQLGDLVRRLHWLEEPASLGLRRLDPLETMWARIRGAEGLAEEDRAFLWARAQMLAKRFDELDFVLPFGMVHGDANVGNALLDEDGNPVLIDLDGFAVGPREWDLVLTALYFDRYGWHTRAEYDAFVHAYGFDVMNWYGYETLADLRELMMTVWLTRKITTDADAAAEVARRIDDLRSGGDRHGWKPF